MILLDLQDVLRTITGAHRVQMLVLPESCSSPEASGLDFQFRDQLYVGFDYSAFATEIMGAVPEDGVIDYRDDFGLHYLVVRGRGAEAGCYLFFGPYLYRAYHEEDFQRLLSSHGLTEDSVEALRWYFKRIPVISDYMSWRNMFSNLMSRYLANPDLEILRVTGGNPSSAPQKPAASLSTIPHKSIEARYAVENAMLEAIRRGDIAEATYQQNLFLGFTLDLRVSDYVRNAKDMIISVNTLFRKTIEQAAVHPLYIDGISGQFMAEIERAETEEQVTALIPIMIRHYCLLVQKHSLERYSGPVRDCINYIDFHYMEPLSLESLAARQNINKNYLSSRFHREVGVTVTDYINRIRIRHALHLLDHSEMTMQQIAEGCGFSDANYFSRVFKKIRGATPQEFRRKREIRQQHS